VEPAIKQAEYAVSLDDELAPVRVSLGIIYLRTGRHEEAITEFRHALILEQNHTDALLGLAQAYEKNQELDRAESMYRQAIQSKPDYWSGYNKFGLFYFNQGRYEDAKEQFEQIIKRK
jgi:Tfp pilus assembly protein PilF